MPIEARLGVHRLGSEIRRGSGQISFALKVLLLANGLRQFLKLWRSKDTGAQGCRWFHPGQQQDQLIYLKISATGCAAVQVLV
jgi:hypothetical protein